MLMHGFERDKKFTCQMWGANYFLSDGRQTEIANKKTVTAADILHFVQTPKRIISLLRIRFTLHKFLSKKTYFFQQSNNSQGLDILAFLG